jgi:hypothetical protein
VRSIAAAAVAAIVAVALGSCGGTQDTVRRQLATYLTGADQTERQLAVPVSTVDAVDRALATSSSGRRKAGAAKPATPQATPAQQERRLNQAAAQIDAVRARLRAQPAPAPAAHLKALLVELAGRQAALAVQTERLVAFIPGLTRSLRPLGPSVVTLERVLSVNRANGATAVAQVYAAKAAALRTFARRLSGILVALGRVTPPSSSEPTYATERRSLERMRAASLTLAGDLSGGRRAGVAGALRAFDRAAALPGSRAAQEAERAAVRAYDRQVAELQALVSDANRERLALAQRYP